MLGLDCNLGVRAAWPTAGQPDWSVDQDICFLRVTGIDDPYNRQRDISYSGSGATLTRRDTYTRVIAVNFILYGPNSFEYAEQIRGQMFWSDPKYTLAQGQLFPIPDIPQPIRFPELFQGQWWQRTDLTIRFNQFMTWISTVPAIEQAQIRLVQEDGKETEINGTLP